MKKFIMSCPFQPEGSLRETKYEVSGNPKLEYKATRFPIIPVINAYVEKGETIKLIVIKSDNSNVAKNEILLNQEIADIEQEKSIHIEIENVHTKYSEDINTQLQLYADLVSLINNGDELYACYTYGTKPTPIIENMAIGYAHRAMKDVQVGCIVYGQLDHVLQKSYIFDITPLFNMEDISNSLSRLGLKDPAKKIQEILDL